MSGKDHGYILPEVIDPQRIRLCIEIPDDLNHKIAFWGALQELGHPYNWHNDDAHTALLAAAVWRDVYYRARDSFAAGECASEEVCQSYSPKSPRLTWYPENPFEHDPVPPTGYLFHPFTVVDSSLISTIISEWGLGYKVGDVYTDITKLPAGDWGEIIDDGYLFFPRFRINDLNGAGTVKIHFLNIPQGGRALIVVDGVLDLLNLQLIELNKDGVSIPPETQVPIVIEVPIETVGDHYVDVVFVPNVNDEPIPFFFGGGVRQIEICGFGLEGCDDVTDPCCPETNDTLKRILTLLEGGATINFNTQGQPSDFTVTCSPDNFAGNEGDDVPAQIMRQNAMCLTIARWLVSILASQAVKMNKSNKLNDIWALGGFLSAPEMYGQIQYIETDMSIAHLTAVLEDDTAFNLMVCRVMMELSTESNTFVIFKKQFDEIYDDVSMEENPAFTILAMVARDYSKNRYNYEVFSHGLETSFNDIDDGLEYDCSCSVGTCDAAELMLIPVNDCTVTRVDDTHWLIEQMNYTDAPPDKRQFTAIVRDQFWRCFNYNSSDSGQSAYDNYDCTGTHVTGTGGGTGEQVQMGYIIFEYDTDPVVGLHATVEILCP